MTSPLIKAKVLQEIDLIPEDNLFDLYNFIHYFRLGLESLKKNNHQQTMAFAGCWQDMDEDIFTNFSTEITQRRKQAFEKRRKNESYFG